MSKIRDELEKAARLNPDRVAIQFESTRLTFSQLREQVAATAYQLRASGLTADDTVALVLKNTPESVVMFLALAWLDASLIPLEAEHIKQLNSPRPFDGIPIKALLCEGSEFFGTTPISLPDGCSLIDTRSLATAVTTRPIAEDRHPPGSNQPFLYHFTSGSTGRPKAALHSQDNLINGGIIYKQTYGLAPDDRILTTVPLAHSFGMVGGLISALVSGARIVFTGRFIPRQVLELLAGEDITVLMAVPFIYDLLSRCYVSEMPDLSRLRICLSSGSPLPAQTRQAFQTRYQKFICQVYGTTETGIITAQWPRAEDWPEGSVGRPVDGVTVRLVGDGGQEQPSGEPGHLLVRTPAMFSGYYNHPEATGRVLREGWYATGDVAWQDESGHLYLHGRKNTFINVGGRKVNPFEVEEALLAHDMVRDAIVFGQEVDGAGEQVMAAVVLSGELSPQELVEYCRECLAFYKVPYKIEFVQTIPRTGMGKALRASDTRSV